MGRDAIRGLINSLSRFNLVIASQSVRSTVLKDFGNIVSTLKLLKPVLDEAVDLAITSDEGLLKASEELDSIINQAREILEKRPQRVSKICNILKNEPMVVKVQKLSMEICNNLSRLLQPCSFTWQSASVKLRIQEIQLTEHVLTSQLIEGAIRDQRDHAMPKSEDIMKMMESLGLTSGQDLLLESIALEKERIKAELTKMPEEAECFNQIIALVNHSRCYMETLERFGFINGIPIPSYFRCPLSLELMVDPVILATGQTYERSCIQKWLDNGLRICPKTRQTLSHINLVPNDTVKALIVNWCEDNNVMLFDSAQPDKSSGDFSTCMFVKELNLGSSLQEDSPLKDSTSRYSYEHENEILHLKSQISPNCKEESSCLNCQHLVQCDSATLLGIASHQKQSSCHSRSESMSSTISSVELSSMLDGKFRLLGDNPFPSCSPSNKDIAFLPWFSPSQLSNSSNGSNNDGARSFSSSVTSYFDDVTTISHAQKLVEDLQSESPELQVHAAYELRLLTKNNIENRGLVGISGAIEPLISLLYSRVKRIQEHAVTALLNLSINNHNKLLIADSGAIEPLIRVLESGSPEARENSAATLFSLSIIEEYKVKIGRSDAVKGLVNLLGSGSIRGKKDAATALFNLSILHENKARIVQAGAVKYLVELLDPCSGMVDKSVALLANLSTIPEGRSAVVQEGGILLLVETVETGSARGKENAASALLQICINSQKFCNLVLQEGAVPPLIALSQFGTPRAKEKAQQVLSHFRSQREGGVGRGKP